MDAIYRERVESLDQISTLPQQLRMSLQNAGVAAGLPEIQKKIVSQDGTIRYLIGFPDGQSVEAVGMPQGDGGEAGDGSAAGDSAAGNAVRGWDRATICVSSQVGFAVDCHFCLTALLGVKRNLSAGEIVGQVCAVLRDQNVSPPQDRINLVFMWMGEPFLNYDNFMKAVRLLVVEVRIPESRMTVSPPGSPPPIYLGGGEGPRADVVISL